MEEIGCGRLTVGVGSPAVVDPLHAMTGANAEKQASSSDQQLHNKVRLRVITSDALNLRLIWFQISARQLPPRCECLLVQHHTPLAEQSPPAQGTVHLRCELLEEKPLQELDVGCLELWGSLRASDGLRDSSLEFRTWWREPHPVGCEGGDQGFLGSSHSNLHL